jgi:hypothetical protein
LAQSEQRCSFHRPDDDQVAPHCEWNSQRRWIAEGVLMPAVNIPKNSSWKPTVGAKNAELGPRADPSAFVGDNTRLLPIRSIPEIRLYTAHREHRAPV